MGYTGNTRKNHQANSDKDGQCTNEAIRNILGRDRLKDELLDQAFREHCKSAGIVIDEKIQRRY